MRRLPFQALLLLCTLAFPAHAWRSPGPYGVNIRWDACFADGGTLNKNFACDTNTGSEKLVLSFVLPFDMPGVSGMEGVIDLASAGTTLPAWWAFKNVGTCRQISLGLNFVPPSTAVNCADWSNGQASGGIGAYNLGTTFSNGGSNSARLVFAIAVPPSLLASPLALDEYFVGILTINHAKTVGTGACAGCATPVCIVFNSLKLTTQVPVNDRTLKTPSNFTDSNYATWQGGLGVVTNRGSGCPAATPTKPKTWGAVKSLYR
jgi:hypothetical protein